jgi:hypothetical protein
MSTREPRKQSLPATGPNGQAVIDWLLARVGELEFCEHDLDGSAIWISTRPNRLLCGVLLPGRSGAGAEHQANRTVIHLA